MSESPVKITPIHSIPTHCSLCGAPLEKKFVAEENQKRWVCPKCRTISYLNPKVVAGAIPSQNGKILLLKRGIEPQKGFWTFPAGFMELWESAEEAAARETLEEIGIRIEISNILGVYSYSDAAVVTIVYLARAVGGEIQTSGEAQEVKSFGPGEIPWENLAFRSTKEALKDWETLQKKR